MGHRLMHLRHPALHHARARGVARPPRAPSTRPTDGREPPLRDRGVGLLTVFTGSALLIIGLVWLVGGVDRWWILIPVMAIDLAVTAAVLAMMIRLLDDGDGG